jgi:predicted membrane channel-forming protein YqfA (hemolysin III family)
VPADRLVRPTTARGLQIAPTAVSEVRAKPRLRGVFHQYAFFVSLASGILLVLLAATTRASLAVGIYAASVSALFGVSALYHRVTWGTPARRRMRRLDHAMIFLLIAGTGGSARRCIWPLAGWRWWPCRNCSPASAWPAAC